MVQLCKIMIFPGAFFFKKKTDFFIFRGVKGQKIAQNGKKICFLRFISEEPYII